MNIILLVSITIIASTFTVDGRWQLFKIIFSL